MLVKFHGLQIKVNSGANWLIVTKYPFTFSQMLMDRFPFYGILFSRSPTSFLPDFTMIWITRRVSYSKQELLTLHWYIMGSPPVFWWDPCCSSCVFFRLHSVFCENLTYICLCLIAHSVFSRVYFRHEVKLTLNWIDIEV